MERQQISQAIERKVTFPLSLPVHPAQKGKVLPTGKSVSLFSPGSGLKPKGVFTRRTLRRGAATYWKQVR
jgi:hypothetical protein